MECEIEKAMLDAIIRMILLCTLAGIATASFAAELPRQQRDVAGFHGIDYSGPGELYLTQGDTESLQVQAQAAVLDNIVTRVEHGVLKIYFKNTRLHTDLPIHFAVSFVGLDSLQLSGSSEVRAQSVDAVDFELVMSGSSDVQFERLDCESLKLSTSGSGSVNIAELLAKKVRDRQ